MTLGHAVWPLNLQLLYILVFLIASLRYRFSLTQHTSINFRDVSRKESKRTVPITIFYMA